MCTENYIVKSIETAKLEVNKRENDIPQFMQWCLDYSIKISSNKNKMRKIVLN